MKKKELITIIIIAVVALFTVVSCVYLANQHRMMPNDGKNKIIRSGYHIDGAFLYFNKNGTVMRYNSLNGDVTKLCGHEEKTYECHLERISGDVCLSDNKLYFTYRPAILENNQVEYYDLSSGEVHGLGIELENQNKFVIYGEKIYYVSENAIFCMSAGGGKPSKLTDCLENETVFLAADGKIFTYTYLVPSSHTTPIGLAYIFSYDIKTLKKTDLFSFSTSQSYPMGKAEYFDGNLYMIINCELSNFNTGTETGFISGSRNVLICIDTKKNETIFIYNNEIQDFFVTEEYIYYFPYEERTVNYIHTNMVMEHKTTIKTICSDEILRSDLDGNNMKTVYTNPSLAYETRYIVNGNLFGSFIGDCPELGINADGFYASIDLQNGKITKIEIP